MVVVRSTLIGTAILLILGAGAVWVLNVEGIVKGSWSSPLAVAFGVVGALFTFLQWALPLSPASFKAATDIHPLLVDAQLMATLSTEQHFWIYSPVAMSPT